MRSTQSGTRGERRESLSSYRDLLLRDPHPAARGRRAAPALDTLAHVVGPAQYGDDAPHPQWTQLELHTWYGVIGEAKMRVVAVHPL